MPRWPRVFELIGLNTIPIVGVFTQGWSASTALMLYWLESVAMSAFLLAAGTDHAPPAWIAWLSRFIPSQKGETFDQYWRRTHAEAAAQAASDEETIAISSAPGTGAQRRDA